MSALVVFTGGVRSGKSRLAAELAGSRGGAVCVAVGGERIDEEMERRIVGHSEDRPSEWRVVEVGEDALATLAAVGPEEVLLVDCLGSIAGRIVAEAFREAGESEPEPPVATSDLERRVEIELSGLVDLLIDREGDTVVVTNEVGDGVVPATASGRLFRDALGRANQRLVEAADRAYLVVAGRPVDLARVSSDPAWPERA